PFLLIYLHNVRGIPFGLAGSAAAVQSAAALASGFLGGTLSDRAGPKRVLLGALAVMTVAFGLMPLIRTAPEAFAIYTLWGIGSGRAVLRDRVFTSFTLLNAAFMTAGISLAVEILPAFGKNVAHIDERQVGVVFALGAVGIVLFQLPVVKLAEGRSRMRGFALMGILWAASLLAVGAAGAWTRATAAFAILAGAMLVFAVGECLHGAIHAPLSVDLAPPSLVGRYLAASSISWQIGWIVRPAAVGSY